MFWSPNDIHIFTYVHTHAFAHTYLYMQNTKMLGIVCLPHWSHPQEGALEAREERMSALCTAAALNFPASQLWEDWGSGMCILCIQQTEQTSRPTPFCLSLVPGAPLGPTSRFICWCGSGFGNRRLVSDFPSQYRPEDRLVMLCACLVCLVTLNKGYW